MTIAIFVILILTTVFMFENNIGIALALSGVLFLLWRGSKTISELKKQQSLLETKLEHQQESLRVLEAELAENRRQDQASETDITWDTDEGLKEIEEREARDTIEPQPTFSDDIYFSEDFREDSAVYNEFPNVAPVEPEAEIKANEPSKPREPEVFKHTLPIQNTAQRNKQRTPQVNTPFSAALIDKLIQHILLLISAAWGWVTTGNIFVRVGMIILFMGMTFLTRYAIGQNLIPIELRLAAVSAVAIALLVWGWLQREKRAQFALVVQGGGVGLFYLTIFASFSLYDVISSTLAFVLLLVTVCLTAILAVLQQAKALAVFATIGGFLAPILASSGSNNFVGLFTYYTILNLGIFAIAWFQSWRILNFIGFIFTFGVATLWRASSYDDAYFWQFQPFLLIFFLLYYWDTII